MTLEELQKLNTHIRINDVCDASFSTYGRIIDEYDFSYLITCADKNTTIPEDGNTYIASVNELEKTEIYIKLQNEFYGEMPIQIGYCNGRNSTLNGLEYHMGSEINVAVTDMVLILGRLQDVEDKHYDVTKAEAFFVKKGTAIQLYETTLHFAPCKITGQGFKCIVVLLKGTNTPLEHSVPGNGKLLFATNKWLLAHPQRKPLMERGAWPGITGDNIEIKFN